MYSVAIKVDHCIPLVPSPCKKYTYPWAPMGTIGPNSVPFSLVSQNPRCLPMLARPVSDFWYCKPQHVDLFSCVEPQCAMTALRSWTRTKSTLSGAPENSHRDSVLALLAVLSAAHCLGFWGLSRPQQFLYPKWTTSRHLWVPVNLAPEARTIAFN